MTYLKLIIGSENDTAESVDIALSEQAGLTNELAINQTVI